MTDPTPMPEWLVEIVEIAAEHGAEILSVGMDNGDERVLDLDVWETVH